MNDNKQNVHELLRERGLPKLRSISIDCTTACNLRCSHCYLTSQQRANTHAMLDVKRFAAFLPVLARNGCFEIRFVGGEPLLHPQFDELYYAAKKAGLVATVFTNGTLLTHEWIKFFQRYPVYQLIITLYGASDAEYQVLSPMRENFLFSRLVSMIQEIETSKIDTKLQCRLSKDNIDLPERLARVLKVDHVPSSIITYPRPNDKTNMKNMAPVSLLKENSGSRHIPSKLRLRDIIAPLKLRVGCGAGLTSVHITIDWHLKACYFLDDICVPLTLDTFEQIFYEQLPMLLSGEIAAGSACAQCPTGLQDRCARCAALGYGTKKHAEERDILCYRAQHDIQEI